MSRARHKAKASGGKAVAYNAADSNVMKEAHERKKGGRVHHHGEGEEAKHRHDRKERKRGGSVKHHHAHGVGRHHEEGHPAHHTDGGVEHHAKMHKEPRGRKRGGGIGANRMPLSTAANIKEVTKGEDKEDLGQH